MPTYARTFEHPQSTAKLAIIKPNPEKAGTRAGTLAETVRRRFAVADLMKAGLPRHLGRDRHTALIGASRHGGHC
jgi:hypothetical protein